MKKIALPLICFIFLVLSCINKPAIPEDNSDDFLNVDFYESLVTYFKNRTDSLAGKPVIQKMFWIDKRAIRTGKFKQLDSVFVKRMANGIRVKEDRSTYSINPKYSTYFIYDTLTDILKDTSYVVCEKCQNPILSSKDYRLYLVRIVNNEYKLKLLSDFSMYDCWNQFVISGLSGDSIIYTYKYSSFSSDIITDSGSYSTEVQTIRKYNLLNDRYYTIDSILTEGY